MQIAIIASSKDPAGVNIRNNLLELFDFNKTNEKFDNNDAYECNKFQSKNIKLYLTNEDLIFSERIDEKINADVFVFASKHRSKENTKSFAVHPIGNWDKNEFGGKEKSLCPSSAVLLKNLFVELNNIAKSTKIKDFRDTKNQSVVSEFARAHSHSTDFLVNSGYELTMEATHHGPYIEKPAVFVEVGSTEEEWNNAENGKIIAKTIMSGLKNENLDYKIAVGIGGPHYCSNFNKVALRTDIAFSHICPKYMLDKLNEELIKQSIGKTKEKIDFIVLDWKGLGAEKQRIIDMLQNLNLEFKRTDQILN